VSTTQNDWGSRIEAGFQDIARRLIPVYWRKIFREEFQRLSSRKRGNPVGIPRAACATNRPDVLVFAGVAGRAANDRCLDAFAEDGWRIFRFAINHAGENDLGSFENLFHEQAIEEALCVVEHPAWARVVATLRERYGWKIVIDDAAFNQDKSVSGLLEARAQLSAMSDFVLAEQPADAWRTLRDAIVRLYGKASIIIVSYNGLDLIRNCVTSILERTVYPNYEVIIVDNNSVAEVKAYLIELQRTAPCVRVVLNDTNKGFAAANNIGLRQAQSSDFVILLNNDTIVPRGWLCRLLRHVRKPDVGMVGPVTNWTGNEARIDVGYTDLKDMQDFARTWTHANEGKCFDIRVTAMYCVAMRRAVVNQVGLLDERFGLGMFEDEDYARRVRQAGYRVICAEDVFVHHHGMASFAKLDDAEYRNLFERNRRLYEEKWGEPWVPHKSR